MVKLKELQGSDYERLGLSRGVLATMSGDDEKMAKSLIKNAKEKGINLEVMQDADSGEFGVFIDGKFEGLINKKGVSRQDFANLLRDPTNLAFFLGPVGAGLRGLSTAGKVAKVAKQAGKVGGAAAGIDLATTTSADIANKDLSKENAKGNIARAGAVGAITPVADLVGNYATKKIANKLAPRKQKLANEGVPLTKGQALDNKKDLTFEAKVAKGGLGNKSQEILDNYKAKQIEKAKKLFNKELGATFDDAGVNVEKAEEIQDLARQIKGAKKEEVVKLYNEADLLGAGLSRENAKDLTSSIDEALDFDARDAVKSFGKDTPEYEAVQVIDKLKNAFKQDDLVQKNKNPNNLTDVFKNQAGDVDIRFNDGSLNNFKYGDFKPDDKGIERGFVGKKIEKKHPNVATKNLKQKLKNAKQIKKEGEREVYLTQDGIRVVVDTNPRTLRREILTAYYPDGRKVSNETGSPALERSTTYASDVRHQIPLDNKTIAQNNEISNRLYDVISLKKLEQGRRVINQALEKAVAKENKASVANLMKVKEAFDNKIDDLANQGRFEGDKAQVDKLIKARGKEAEYERLFSNIKQNEFDKNITSYGAKEVLDLINNPDKTGAALADVFKNKNTTKQLGAIRKVREIFGEGQDETMKEMYVNSIFADLRTKREGNLNLNEAIKNINEKIETNKKVAKELFSEKEIAKMVNYKDLLEKINKTYDPNPSGSGEYLLKAAARRLPGSDLVMSIPDYIMEQLINPIRVRNYLKKDYITLPRYSELEEIGKKGIPASILTKFLSESEGEE